MNVSRVLVQAPRRRMHLAAVYGPGVYASLCNRVLVEVRPGVEVFPFSEAGGPTRRLVDELRHLTRGRTVCTDCARLIAWTSILEADRWPATV